MTKVNELLHQIAIVAIVPPPVNGMTNVSKKIAELLTENGGTIVFGVSRPKLLPNVLWGIYRQLGLAIQTLRAAACKAPAVYFVLDSNNGLLGNLLIHIPILALSRKHIILHHHVFSYISKKNRRVSQILRMLRGRNSNIVLCECMGQKLQKSYLDAENIAALGNAAFIATEGEKEGKFICRTLGFLSNITFDKGIDAFIETVSELTEKGFAIEAVIAGPVTSKEVDRAIADFVAGSPETRRYVGPVYGESKKAFFNDVDVLLFPSRYVNEAQPVTIFEALAYGMPVLAKRRGCIEEQIPQDWVYEDNDFVANASEMIGNWINDPDAFRNACHRSIDFWIASRHLSQLQQTMFLKMVGSQSRLSRHNG